MLPAMVCVSFPPRTASAVSGLALLVALSGPAAAEPARPASPIAAAPAAVRLDTARPDPAKAEPVKPESAKPEPAKVEAARPVPAKPDPTAVPAPPSGAPQLAARPGPVAAVPEPVKLSADPHPTLGPGTFVAIMSAAERYRAIVDAGGWSSVPNGATAAKPATRSPAIAALRVRLAVTGDLAPEAAGNDLFDDALGAAIRRFQDRHGLPETGTVGPRTLVELNVPAETRLRSLQASGNRLLGSTFPFGDRYVAVNIPAATVEAVAAGTVARRYVAVVGKTDRPSPTIAARIQNVNFNPTWTVPVSLIRKDIIPHMRKDPGYLAKMRIRILDGQNHEIDPKSIDWSTEKAVNYTLRQDPGPENSLGEIRIDMPNKLAVYMHDTPSKKLFARNSRMNSSGCVRVSGVRELAEWLLERETGPAGPGTKWGQPEIAAAIASGERAAIKLTKQVPVIWTYLTGYASADGTVHFRDDVYKLDEPAAPAAEPLTIEALVTGSLGGEKR